MFAYFFIKTTPFALSYNIINKMSMFNSLFCQKCRKFYAKCYNEIVNSRPELTG